MADKPEKKKRAPKAEVFREAHARTLIDWTPAMIRQAEVAADGGNLRQAADLWDCILTDDRVQGVMGALSSVVSLPLEFDPDIEPKPEPSVALGGRKGDWWRIFPDPALQEMIRWGRGLGVAIAYIAGWHRNEESGNLIPDVQVWHPRNIRWDPQLDKWFVKVFGGAEEEVTPGDGQWILYTPYGSRRPWAKGAWRGLSRWWLIKRYAQHDWASYSERQGNGTEVISEETPEGNLGLPVADDDESPEDRRQALSADLRKLKRNAKIVLPPGFKYDLVESKARTWETFQAQKDCADSAMAIAIVGQNLSSEVSSGSLAAAEVHSRVEGRVIRDTAESLSTMAHDQVLPTYTVLNYGDHPVPWPVYDTTPPEDQKAKTEAQKNFSETLIKMKDAGYEVENAEELGLKLGMKLKRNAAAPSDKSPTSEAN